MHFFRKLITHRKLAALLTIGMLLRSIVAVGYMLDSRPADGSLLSIKICGGPAGINAIASLTGHQHHKQHHGHNNDKKGHDHGAKDHPFSSCSFWSSSSQSLLTDITIFDLRDPRITNELIVFQDNSTYKFLNNTRFARAPPSLS